MQSCIIFANKILFDVTAELRNNGIRRGGSPGMDSRIPMGYVHVRQIETQDRKGLGTPRRPHHFYSIVIILHKVTPLARQR